MHFTVVLARMLRNVPNEVYSLRSFFLRWKMSARTSGKMSAASSRFVVNFGRKISKSVESFHFRRLQTVTTQNTDALLTIQTRKRFSKFKISVLHKDAKKKSYFPKTVKYHSQFASISDEIQIHHPLQPATLNAPI